MTTYQNLHWDSLDVLKDHLLQQVITPLSQVSECLETVQQAGSADPVKEPLRNAAQRVSVVLNLVKTWTALIEVKNGGTLPRTSLSADGLPPWLVSTLSAQTAFQAGHTQPVLVHTDTFYASLILACQIGASIGTLKSLATCDSKDGGGGLWVRAVFDPPPSGPYRGVLGLFRRLESKNGGEREAANQLQLLQWLIEINGGSLKVQNNLQTGEQALALRFPRVPAAVPVALPASAAAIPQAIEPKTTGEPDAKPAEPEPPKDEQPEAESADKLAVPVAPAGQPAAPGTEIKKGQAIPDDGENASDTLIIPPAQLRERLAAARPEAKPAPAPTADEDAAPETLIVAPPGLRDRRAALAEAESRPSETPEAPSPTAAADHPTESSAVEAAPPDATAASSDQASGTLASEEPATHD
jgi:hypothetical protein